MPILKYGYIDARYKTLSIYKARWLKTNNRQRKNNDRPKHLKNDSVAQTRLTRQKENSVLEIARATRSAVEKERHAILEEGMLCKKKTCKGVGYMECGGGTRLCIRDRSRQEPVYMNKDARD
ncbi:hypothetical protein G5I_10161 [Acromyrmex echinatior]|uniref:Uncharacterized protein n=1 Tax=Acromyrmex echinatior TaxID=103372 RepID=F4WW08_ACREC|nr:hypothetical protein G5I_10161 [Acromyrmex echinatior]